MVVEGFVPSVNQFIETGIEEISLQVAEPLNDSFLNFDIGSEIETWQVLLQRSEEIQITRCEIRAVRRAFHCIYGGRDRQYCTLVFVKENRVCTQVFVT
ncbi:hypothetical protein AVEN_92352-1 [Araneus ventricosus]|uniref:Uncharacterized protein n=1 Tax=Araneus ventricosus TaxID=182803 RepID=A0A4Y2AIM2_ARAVE|nr:hypothetical protein AVEN_92352-1 [Araneus ventricosus]